MIRIWLTFVFLIIVIHFGISIWRGMTKKERWSLTKTLGYSIIVSLLAVIAMMCLVLIF